MEEYFRAYFRDGHFLQINLNAQNFGNELKKRFPLLSDLTESDVKNILKSFGVDPTGSLFGNVGTLGFVTRGGLTFQFPVLAVGLDPTAKQAITLPEVEAVGVGTDLMRVFLEASFDAFTRLPAVSNATGCLIKDKDDQDCRLPVFEPKPDGITADKFSNVNTIANGAEAVASCVFGRLVRGVGPIALNNEALAQLVETLIGVTVRKAVEKGAWCWYACKLSESETQGETVITVTISGAAPKADATGRQPSR